ncbi:unnamed protein product [Urochloa humidicola]
MPELRRLYLDLDFRATQRVSRVRFGFSFEHLARLEHIFVGIWCNSISRSTAEAAEAAIGNAVSIHPGRPTLTLVVKVERNQFEDNDEGEDRSGLRTRHG